MIFTIKITTLDNRKITVEGDSRLQYELTISEYWDQAKEITANLYRPQEDQLEYIK